MKKKYDFWLYFPMHLLYLHMLIILRHQGRASSTEQGCAPKNNCLENYQTWHMLETTIYVLHWSSILNFPIGGSSEVN
jgi:hypothetical protein